MPIRRNRTKYASIIAGSTLALASPLVSSALAHQAEGEEQVLVAFSHAGVDAMFSDPNDAGLKRALDMILPRFMELRNSNADFAADLQEIPEEMLTSVASMIGAPMHFVVTGNGFDADTGAPIFNVLLSFDMDKGDADALHSSVNMLTNMGPGGPEFEESERYAGMMQMFTPMGPLSFGPREANDGWRYELLFGGDIKPDAMREMLPDAPRGQRQLASGVLDFEALSPLTNMGAGFLAMASPQGEQIVEQFRNQGILGEGAMRVEMTSWTDGTTSTSQVVSRRARNFREGMMLPESVLTPADLAIIPADATAAYVGKFSPTMIVEGMLEQVKASVPDADEGIDEVLAQIKEQTGIDVMNDLLPSIGETMVMYFSDSTGGGSLLSGVVAVKAADKGKLNNIIQRVEGMAAEMSRSPEFGNGIIGLRPVRSTHNGNPMVTYRLSGLPIPVAPSMTIVDDWFVMGMTPQAAMAAAEMTGRRNGRGLLDNPRFAAAYNAQPETIAVAFVDTQRTLADGVTTLNLLSMALGNVVTSAKADGPMLGAVMPPLAQLRDGAQPLIQQTFWKGDDLVQWSTTDASVLVSTAAILGVGDAAPLIGGIAIGAGLGGAIADQARGAPSWDEGDWDDDWDDDWDEEIEEDPEY